MAKLIDLENIPNYDPDIVETIASDFPPEELKPLKETIKRFLKVNVSRFSLSTLSRFLGTSRGTTLKLLGIGQAKRMAKSEANTIIIVKPSDDFDTDYLKYRAGLI